MIGINAAELEFVKECIKKVAKNRQVKAACLYGSRVAGYARQGSDIDLLIVLDRFPYGVTYEYFRDRRGDVSALVVGSTALEKDALGGLMGEFVIGRLLHVYQPLEGANYLINLEQLYKKRVIIEEVKQLVTSTGILCREILFPLEFIHFSKIKRRAAHYPSAAYSYYKTYSASESQSKNIESALTGYRLALESIVREDPGLFVRTGNALRVSQNRITVEKGIAKLRISRRLQQFSSYLIHTYAGLKVMHRSVGEAEAKIRRRIQVPVQIPKSISDPKSEFCSLPEGFLICGESGNWLEEYVAKAGFGDNFISTRQRLGNPSSQTILYTLSDPTPGSDQKIRREKKIVVKQLGIAKSIKWSALNVWTAPVKKYNVDSLFLTGSEYLGLRYIRKLGLNSPIVEAVVLERRLIVTNFVQGRTMADIIKKFLAQRTDQELVTLIGEQIAKVHSAGSSFGNLKPKNIIENGDKLFFTDLAQLEQDSPGEQPWDIAQFISWALKRTSDVKSAREFVRNFLDGYQSVSGAPRQVISKLAGSRRHIESFYPVLSPQVARTIKQEVRKIGIA